MKHILLIIPIIFLLSCRTHKETIYQPTPVQVFFGNYGGFTNQRTEYVLNNDGNIFKIEKDGVNYIKTLKKKNVKEITKMLDNNSFEKLEYNTPGNFSYFIKVISPKYSNEVTWSEFSLNEWFLPKVIYSHLSERKKRLPK